MNRAEVLRSALEVLGRRPVTAHSVTNLERAEAKRARRNAKRLADGGMLQMDGPRAGYAYGHGRLASWVRTRAPWKRAR